MLVPTRGSRRQDGRGSFVLFEVLRLQCHVKLSNLVNFLMLGAALVVARCSRDEQTD